MVGRKKRKLSRIGQLFESTEAALVWELNVDHHRFYQVPQDVKEWPDSDR